MRMKKFETLTHSEFTQKSNKRIIMKDSYINYTLGELFIK